MGTKNENHPPEARPFTRVSGFLFDDYPLFPTVSGTLFEYDAPHQQAHEPYRAHGHGHGHGHGHSHSHGAEQASRVIGHMWKWAAFSGNAVVGAAELFWGKLDTLAATIDGVHNAGDSVTYLMQANDVLYGGRYTEQQLRSRRRLAYSIISGLSLLGMVHVGYDLATHDETRHNPAVSYAAIASVALNGALLTKMQINKKRQERLYGPSNCSGEHDLRKHMLAVDIPSALLATGGALLQRAGVEADINTFTITAEQVAAVVSGGLGMVAFRPWGKNLDHVCEKF